MRTMFEFCDTTKLTAVSHQSWASTLIPTPTSMTSAGMASSSRIIS